MAYCDNNDLVNVRPSILSYGIVTWTEDIELSGVVTGVDKLTEAESQVNRIIEIRWYRQAAKAQYKDPLSPDGKFDPSKVKEADLKRATVYKVLELAYQYLMNDAPEPDAFERNSEYFAKEFQKEMEFVLAEGITYDWDDDGSTADEYVAPVSRRLMRG